MSLTLTAAKEYIGRIVGVQDDTDGQAQSADALAAAMEVFSHRNNWNFLLQDTSQSFVVLLGVTNSTTTVTTATANGFKDVLVGMTITDAGSDIPASTTVASIESNTSLTMSAAATGATDPATLTFGGTIPIIAGTDSYTLPARFWKPYDCRLTSAVFRPLEFMQHNRYDMLTRDQTVQGSVEAYTIYNGADFDASGTQQTKIKFFRVPNQADVALLKYYRTMVATADPIDVLDEYQYALLAQARVEILREKNATDRRIPLWENIAERKILDAIRADRSEGGDAQMDRFITPNERGRPGSGEFFPSSDIAGLY